MRSRCMLKSWQRWTTSGSTSTKVPASTSRSTRSCAVSLPASCWRWMRSAPPPKREAARRRSRSSNLVRVELMREAGARAVVDGPAISGKTKRGAFVYHTAAAGAKVGGAGRPASYNPAVSFLEADTAALARCLTEVSDDPADLVEAFFERTEQVVLAPSGESPALRVWREEGFSIRFASRGQTWMVARDGIDGSGFLEALRKTARRMAQGLRPPPRLRTGAPPEAPVLDSPRHFVSRVEAELRRRRLAFPLRLEVRRHRRWIQIVSRELVVAP